MKLAYLGPQGTFGEEAALRYRVTAGEPSAELLPFPSHAAVASAVEAKMADAGVVAIENSINGSVAETLDILIHETALQIQAELVLPIELNLLVRPGVRAEDITVIYSHPQPLGQSRRFLERCFPKAQPEAALSTAEAVAMAMRGEPNVAAIGTLRAAELTGAEVLARNIQDAENNVTRFCVLGASSPPPTGRDRTSIAFTFAEDHPGALAGILDVFAAANISCSKIESRPTREAFGEYVFLIDFQGHKDDGAGSAVLREIRPQCAMLKVFGSYPRFA